MDITFNLIKKTRYFEISLIIISVSFGIAYAVRSFRENYGYEPGNAFFIAFFIVLILALVSFSFKKLKYKTYGKLTLNDKDVVISDSFYSLSFINEIIIDVDGYEGQFTWNRSTNSDNNFTKDGADNYITITSEDYKTIKVRFFIEFLYEIDGIKMIVEKWRKDYPHLVIIDSYNR